MANQKANADARALLQQALRREPCLTRAWYLLAMTHQMAIVNSWTDDLATSVRDLAHVCEEFAVHHPHDPGLRIATAYLAVYTGDRSFAMGQLREAIALDPNAATAYSLYGQTLSMDGRADEAIEQFELAVRLSPRDSGLGSIHLAVALCQFARERYDEMLRAALLAVQTRPDLPFPYGAVAVARAYLGDLPKAKSAVDKLLELAPHMSTQLIQVLGASTEPDVVDRFVSGLRRAGFPG
jgi:adenylate cyclase